MPNPDRDDACITHKESVTLRDHFEEKLRGVERTIAALERLMCVKVSSLEQKVWGRLESLEQAVKLAADMMRERLQGMNEWREQSKDQMATYVSRPELSIWRSSVDERLASLQTDRDIAKGKASQQSVNVATILSVVGLLVGLFSLALKMFGGG